MKNTIALSLVIALAAVGCKSAIPDTTYTGNYEEPPADTAEPTEPKLAYEIPAEWVKDLEEPGAVSWKRPSDGASMGVIATDYATPKDAVTLAIAIAVTEGGCWNEDDLSSPDGSYALATVGGCDDGGLASAYAERLGGVVFLVVAYWPMPTLDDAETFGNFADSLRLE